MPKVKIYQIYYNDATKGKLDLGYEPLDNTKNLRADWCEYIPIRRCFLSQEFEEDDYFGVFFTKIL